MTEQTAQAASPLVRELVERIYAEASARARAEVAARVPAWREAEHVPEGAVLALDTMEWQWSASA